MDLVGFDQAVFDGIVAAFRSTARPSGRVCRSPRFRFAPATATTSPEPARGCRGTAAKRCWRRWKRPSQRPTRDGCASRFPVQYVNRPDQSFRGYAGTIASGTIRVGDKLVNATSRIEAKVARIMTMDGDLETRRSRPAGDAGARSGNRYFARRRAGRRSTADPRRSDQCLDRLDGRDAAFPRPCLSVHAGHEVRHRHDHRHHQSARYRYACWRSGSANLV